MATPTSSEGPYASNADGSAKDPAAFQKAVLGDANKMKALEAEPEVLKVVKGQDLQQFQELLKTVYAVDSSAKSDYQCLHRESHTLSEFV